MKSLMLAILLALGALARVAGADEFRQSVEVQSGGKLEVDLQMGAIVIEAHDESRVDVEATSSGWLAQRYTLTGDGTNARLVGLGGTWLAGFNARATIRVPEKFELELKTAGGSIEIEGVHGRVDAHTSGGSVTLEGGEGRAELSTSGGAIRVEGTEGDVEIRTSGGSITVDEVHGAVSARTSGGSIRVSDARGPVDARTSGGGIQVRWEESPGGELRTSGGGIEVELPDGAGVDLDARTSGGRVRIDGEIRVSGELSQNEVVGRIGSGGEKLVLQTSGGNVRVRAR